MSRKPTRSDLLRWSQEKVLKYLLGKGMSPEIITAIRKETDEARQLKLSGHAFADIGWNDFSQIELAMVSVDWERQKQRNVVSALLTSVYGERKRELNRKFSMNTNCMQLLREDTGNYFGNLPDAKGIWKNFIPSNKDWQNSIMIPESIDRTTAQLLGIILTDGIVYKEKRYANPNKTVLSGRTQNEHLYRSVIIPGLRRHFNYIGALKYDRKRGDLSHIDDTQTQSYSYRVPKITITSTALSTWLLYDLNMGIAAGKADRSLPDLDWNDDEIRKGFIEGMLACRSQFGDDSRYLRIKNRHSSTESLTELLDMEKIDYAKNDGEIYIGSESTKNILKNYCRLNPLALGCDSISE